MDWSRYIDTQEDLEFLKSLTISQTQDEFGNNRFYITDFEGNWIGEAFETKEMAADAIKRIRNV